MSKVLYDNQKYCKIIKSANKQEDLSTVIIIYSLQAKYFTYKLCSHNKYLNMLRTQKTLNTCHSYHKPFSTKPIKYQCTQ